VMALLARLAEDQQVAVVMAIHDLNLAARYCHRLLILKEGRVIGSGTPSSLLTPGMVCAVYGVEAAVKDDLGVPYVVPIRPSENENLVKTP